MQVAAAVLPHPESQSLRILIQDELPNLSHLCKGSGAVAQRVTPPATSKSYLNSGLFLERHGFTQINKMLMIEISG